MGKERILQADSRSHAGGHEYEHGGDLLRSSRGRKRHYGKLKIAMSAERDQYPKHHGGFGGTAFIYLKSPGGTDRVIRGLRDVEGIEEILTRVEAAKKYKLNPYWIGDLWVTAVKDVVFGHSKEEREKLAPDYRSHGSAHELDIPGFIYRYAGKLPHESEITTNVDLCKFLYRS